MDVLWILVLIIIALLLVEICLSFLIKRAALNFQWILTQSAQKPMFSESLIEKFLEKSFDSELGWVPRPGSSGIDKTEHGEVVYTIDEMGRRSGLPQYEDRPSKYAVFGDSFSFGRLVGDESTWPAQLSEIVGAQIQNYSVGGYGIDQALIRLKREIGNLEADTVLMCVVPETMARLNSYWRHYFEYGNILAFKPRFTLRDNKLSLIPSFVTEKNDFFSVEANLALLQKLDYFYKTKFFPGLLRFPYTYHLWRSRAENFSLLRLLLLGKLTGRAEHYKRRAFKVVLKNNALHTAKLYKSSEARNLFRLILEELVGTCRIHNKKVVLVITPQPVDLDRIGSGCWDYTDFFKQAANTIDVIDLTTTFTAYHKVHELYVEGELGPHLSERGNQVVAEYLARQLKD